MFPVSLRRSGPSERPGVICVFCMLNTNQDLVPANVNRLRRSARVPWVRLGHETSSFIITSHKQRAVFEGGIFQRKSGIYTDPVKFALGHRAPYDDPVKPKRFYKKYAP